MEIKPGGHNFLSSQAICCGVEWELHIKFEEKG